MRTRNATDEELEQWGADDQEDLNYTYYEDPIETTMNVTDIFDLNDNGDFRTNYTLIKYATYIVNNTFRNNYSGKKGTAMVISGVSELNIFENIFEENGPVTAVREMEYSPYYIFFTNRTKTLSYFINNGTCPDELNYYELC